MADANQAAPSVELDAEAKQLKLEQIKAESRKAIIEAGAATGKALSPAVSADAFKSTLSTGETGGSTLTTMIASDQLGRVAQSIAETMAQEIPGGTVILIDDLSLADDDAARLLITTRIQEFSRALTEAKQVYVSNDVGAHAKGFAVGAGAAAAAISATSAMAALLGGLFKTDVTMASRAVTMSRAALLAEIVQRLRAHNLTVELPGLQLLQRSAVLSALDAAVRLRFELEHLVKLAQYQSVEFRLQSIERLSTSVQALRASWAKLLADGKLTEAGTVKAIVDTEEAALARLIESEGLQERRALNASATSLMTAFDAFVTTLSSSGQGASRSPLVNAMLSEQIAAADSETHVLYVEVTAAGGEVISRPGWAWQYPFMTFVGAVEVSYILRSVSGIRSSGRVSKYGAAEFDFEKSALIMKPHTPPGARASFIDRISGATSE